MMKYKFFANCANYLGCPCHDGVGDPFIIKYIEFHDFLKDYHQSTDICFFELFDANLTSVAVLGDDFARHCVEARNIDFHNGQYNKIYPNIKMDYDLIDECLPDEFK